MAQISSVVNVKKVYFIVTKKSVKLGTYQAQKVILITAVTKYFSLLQLSIFSDVKN